MRRNTETAQQEEKLIPVAMYIYWQAVRDEVNKKLGSNHKCQIYIYEIYKGQKRNHEIEAIIDECIEIVNADFKRRGVCSKNVILPRAEERAA
jgi:hypothetical protein